MKLLITGSKGFIGKQLMQEIKNHEIVEFDKELGNDINDQPALEQKMQGTQAIIHLAAEIQENSPELWKTNVEGTKKIMEIAKKKGIKKIIYLSSAGVYGSSKKQITEETPTNPTTNYEKTKLEAEKIIIKEKKTIKVIIIRSAFVLGANSYWKQIIEMINKGFPLIGGGKNYFHFIYVKDLAKSIKFLIDTNTEGTFIIAQNKALTLKTIYTMIQKQLHIHKPIKEMPIIIARIIGIIYQIIGKKTLLKQEYITRLIKERNYSITKIKQLGWHPTYTAEQAIEETIKDLRK